MKKELTPTMVKAIREIQNGRPYNVSLRTARALEARGILSITLKYHNGREVPLIRNYTLTTG